MPRFHCHVSVGNKSEKEFSVKKVRYILRLGGRYKKMSDPIYEESGNMPFWALQPLDFWRASDRYERANGRTYVQVVFNLAPELSLESQVSVVHQNLKELFGENKLPYTFAIHDEFNPKTGTMNPHCHLIISESADDGVARWADTYFKQAPIGVRKVGILRKGDKVRYFREAACAILNGELRKYELFARYEHRRFDEIFDELEEQIQDLEKDGRIREALDLKLEQLKLCREPQVHEGYSPAKKRQNEEIRKRNEEKAKSLEPYAEAFTFLAALEILKAQPEQLKLGLWDKISGFFKRSGSEKPEPISLLGEKNDISVDVQSVSEIPEVKYSEEVAAIDVDALKLKSLIDELRIKDYGDTGAADRLFQVLSIYLTGVVPGMDFKKWVAANYVQPWERMEPSYKAYIGEALNTKLDELSKNFDVEALEIKIEQIDSATAEAKRKVEQKKREDARKAEEEEALLKKRREPESWEWRNSKNGLVETVVRLPDDFFQLKVVLKGEPRMTEPLSRNELIQHFAETTVTDGYIRVPDSLNDDYNAARERFLEQQRRQAAARTSQEQVAPIGTKQPEDRATPPGREERQPERVRRPARASRDDEDGPEVGR